MVQSSVNPVKYSFQGQNINENACKNLIPNINRDPRVRTGGDHRDLPCRRRGFESRIRILFFGNPDNFKMAKKDDAMRLNLIIQAFFYDPENSNFIVSNGNFPSTSIKIQGPRSFRELLS